MGVLVIKTVSPVLLPVNMVHSIKYFFKVTTLNLVPLLDDIILIFGLSSHFVICRQRYDLLRDALTSSALVPLVITGKI